MKIVFFGSSEFAVPSLELLLKSQHDVLAVVTQPDREKGRDRVLAPTPVKEAASKENVKILQPENVNDPSFSDILRKLSADLFIVVSFGQILSKETLEIPELYSINLHASMLPKYRGAGPVNWAIIKGETKTGLTIIKMNERMDAGDIMLQRKVPIEAEDTAKSLSSRLSYLGGVLVLDAIRFIELDKIKFKRQPKKAGVLAPKLKKEDGLISWGKSAKEVRNRIRGCTPWPGAFTVLDGKILKIWKADIMSYYQKREPGTVADVHQDAIVVVCGKDALQVKEVQLEGGKRMDVASFIRGHNIEKGTILGKDKPISS